MFVCEKCHEIDKRVTSCEEPYDHHIVEVSGNCSVCGKYVSRLKWCAAYRRQERRNAKIYQGIQRSQ